MSKYKDGLSISTKLAHLYLIVRDAYYLAIPYVSLGKLRWSRNSLPFMELLRFIGVLIKTCQLTLFWATLIQATP
jgi:hypothetical protein